MEGTIAGLLLHRYELWWCLVTVPATQSPPSVACSPRQACPTSHPRHGASALACLSFGSQSITRYGAVESGHACLVVVLGSLFQSPSSARAEPQPGLKAALDLWSAVRRLAGETGHPSVQRAAVLCLGRAVGAVTAHMKLLLQHQRQGVDPAPSQTGLHIAAPAAGRLCYSCCTGPAKHCPHRASCGSRRLCHSQLSPSSPTRETAHQGSLPAASRPLLWLDSPALGASCKGLKKHWIPQLPCRAALVSQSSWKTCGWPQGRLSGPQVRCCSLFCSRMA